MWRGEWVDYHAAVSGDLQLVPEGEAMERLQGDYREMLRDEGDVYLRKFLVQSAHRILSARGQDSALKRWGMKLCERGGANAKKRAIVAVARKLAVLLHKLWVSRSVYQPFPA